MSEKIYSVSPEWVKRAYVDDAKYKEMYARSANDPDGFWGEHGKRLDWIKPYTKVKNTTFGPPRRVDQMVRGRHAQRVVQLHRPASRHARRPGRDHLGRRRPVRVQAHHLPRAA